MSRYRKIEVRTWSDEKFRALSGIPPSGQGLWFFLLTGPHTTAIPGLFRAGRAAMSEELGWDLEAFDKAFQEVFEQDMVKADFKAKLVWLPKAIRHNKPESPNVVRGWRVELDLLPECDLKREALASIREALESMGPSYVEAFDELSSKGEKPASNKPAKTPGKPSGKPSPKTTPNQEQEQEQRDNPPTPQGGCARFEDFWSAWPKSERKQDKVKCARKWRSEGLDQQADAILADIAVKRETKKWSEGYVEAPLVYLNGQRWKDGVTPEAGNEQTAGVGVFV